jgi:hypothetical protein
MTTDLSNPALSFDQFCEARRESVRDPLSDPLDKRRASVQSLLEGALGELNEADFGFVETGDSHGLDAFYLSLDENDEGATLFLARFVSPSDWPAQGRLVVQETSKILAALDSGRQHAPLEWAPLFDWLEDAAWSRAVKIVFLSLHSLSMGELESLPNAAALASARLGLECTAENISLETLYEGQSGVRVALRVASHDQSEAPQFLVGSVALLDLFEFLKSYESARGDLDRLYDKNVRLFQGKNRRPNKRMAQTLREEPHHFGLFNNGLTLVARGIERDKNGVLTLVDPSVVNGCQTTRTLFDVLGEEFKSPARDSTQWRAWHDQLKAGQVVVKIVRVAAGEDGSDDKLLEKITRSTNLQTAVKEKDFVALDEDFKRWKRELAAHGIFLEILSGDITTQIARQKKSTFTEAKFAHFAKAFDLLKIYGAGWMNEPGAAWNQNFQFLPPSGRIFKAITGDGAFRGDDLRAAFALQSAAIEHKFGKTGKTVPISRAKTRYVFMRTALELLRRTLRQNGLPDDHAACTRAILTLHEHPASWAKFIREAVDVVDVYMNPNSGCSIAKEPGYAGDFNAFLKRDNLHKGADVYPQIFSEWAVRELLIARDPSYDATRALLKTAFASSSQEAPAPGT